MSKGPGTVFPAGLLQLWILSLATARREEAWWLSLLTGPERETLARCRVEEVRLLKQAGRGLTRWLFGQDLGLPPASVTFETGPHGKPRAIAPEGSRALCFNVSYATAHLALALTRDEVGVDLETIRDLPDLQEVADRFFSPEEADEIRRTGADRRRSFFHAWTRKEALLKASGAGLSQPLDTWTVPLAALPPGGACVNGPAGRTWHLYAPAAGPGLACACACASPCQTIKIVAL